MSQGDDEKDGESREHEEAPPKKRKKRLPSINITIDKSMITAVLALLSTAGFGFYNAADKSADIETTKAGVEIQVNEVQAQHAAKVKKLTRIIKAQHEQLLELRIAVDWMLAGMDEFGRRTNSAAWNRVKRTAPEELDFIAELEDDDVEVEVEDGAEGGVEGGVIGGEIVEGTAGILGHGAGTGTGQGFGAGAGRLGAAPTMATPPPAALPVIAATRVKKKVKSLIDELEEEVAPQPVSFPAAEAINEYTQQKQGAAP